MLTSPASCKQRDAKRLGLGQTPKCPKPEKAGAKVPGSAASLANPPRSCTPVYQDSHAKARLGLTCQDRPSLKPGMAGFWGGFRHARILTGQVCCQRVLENFCDLADGPGMKPRMAMQELRVRIESESCTQPQTNVQLCPFYPRLFSRTSLPHMSLSPFVIASVRKRPRLSHKPVFWNRFGL